MDSDGEAQAHLHAGAIGAQRAINKVFQLRKRHDGIKAFTHLAPRQTRNDRTDKHVLTSCQLRMETGAQIEQRANLAVDFDDTVIRSSDAANEPEQGRFSRAICSDNANHAPRGNAETHVTQRPKAFYWPGPTQATKQRLLERPGTLRVIAAKPLV